MSAGLAGCYIGVRSRTDCVVLCWGAHRWFLGDQDCPIVAVSRYRLMEIHCPILDGLCPSVVPEVGNRCWKDFCLSCWS